MNTLKNRQGQGVVEYGLLIGLVAIVVLAVSFTSFSTQVHSANDNISTKLAEVVGNQGATPPGNNGGGNSGGNSGGGNSGGNSGGNTGGGNSGGNSGGNNGGGNGKGNGGGNGGGGPGAGS